MLKLNAFGSEKTEELIFRKIFKKILEAIKIKDEGYINLIFVNKEAIKSLNKDYRNIDMPTDVLSFVYNEECKGEVIISKEIVEKYASEDGKLPQEELNKTFVHGVLHLFGYDHMKKDDAKRMREKEEEILRTLT